MSFCRPPSTTGAAFFTERLGRSPIRVIEGESWDAMAHADLALAASGTVTVEAALLGTPMVTFYRVTAASWLAGKFLVDVPFYSMVNLIAGRAVVPELMQGQMTGENLAREAPRLLADDRVARRNEGRAGRSAPEAGRRRRRAAARRAGHQRNSGRTSRSCFVIVRSPPFSLWRSAAYAAWAQDRRSRIDVEQYTIDAEVSPDTQSLTAKASVRFMPLDDNITSATFELNNALNVSRVVDDKGKQIPASRNQQDFTVRLSFDQPLPKGQPVTITFYYDGKLSGQEDSPVYGIKFAAIHPDFAYLMYPARWFPVSGYTTDRFSADIHVTVPMGYTVLGSGIDSKETVGDKTRYQIKFERPSFPGSIAIVKGQPARVASEGVTTSLYFRGAGSGHGAALRRADRQDHVVFHRHVRPAALRQSDRRGDRGRRAQRLCRPRHDLPGPARHRQAGQHQAAGQPDLAPVVRGTGLARHAQSPVAHQRTRRLLRTAVERARKRSRGAWRRSCAT